MEKIEKELRRENKILWEAIHDTIWMAIRYAHGRNTYAPSMVRDTVNSLKNINRKFSIAQIVRRVVKKLKKINPYFNLKKDIAIEAPTHKLSGMDFRSDYLDDLFEEEK